jgi:hypothetical protein
LARTTAVRLDTIEVVQPQSSGRRFRPGPHSRVLFLCTVPAGRDRGQDRNDRWPTRVSAFTLPYRAVAEVFDLERSRAFLVGGSKSEALRRESVIKKQFAAWRVDVRSREWFDGAVTDDVLATAASFDNRSALVLQTLRAAMEIQARAGLENPCRPVLSSVRPVDRSDLQ